MTFDREPKPYQQSGVRPTAQVEPFVRVLGEQLAIEFLLTFGGAELHLSERPTGTSEITKLVGRDNAISLASACVGLSRRCPTAKPYIAKVLYAQNHSKSAIARKLHCSDVTVRRWLKSEDHTPFHDDQQLPLF